MVPKCKVCGPAPTRAPAAPAWADPRAMMAQSAVRITPHTSAGAGVESVAKDDPKRVAIGFSIGGQGDTDFLVGPVTLPQEGGWGFTARNKALWFDLFTYGPLVNLEWHCWFADVRILYVYEIYRLF